MNTECLNSGAGKIKETDKVAVIAELRQKYKLIALLNIAEMPRSTYYYYVKQMNQPDKYTDIKHEIQQICHENQGRYGYRKITMQLHNRGYQINHKTVQRLMKALGLRCLVRIIKKYRSYKGETGKIAPNIIGRDFNATEPNQKWTTDIREFSLFGSKLYPSPILDMYNGEIVSYAISSSPVLNQVMDMLYKAFSKIPDDQTLFSILIKTGSISIKCIKND